MAPEYRYRVGDLLKNKGRERWILVLDHGERKADLDDDRHVYFCLIFGEDHSGTIIAPRRIKLGYRMVEGSYTLAE